MKTIDYPNSDWINMKPCPFCKANGFKVKFVKTCKEETWYECE